MSYEEPGAIGCGVGLFCGWVSRVLLGFILPELDYKREEQGVLGVKDNAGCRWEGARRTLPRYLGLTPKQVSNPPC